MKRGGLARRQLLVLSVGHTGDRGWFGFNLFCRRLSVDLFPFLSSTDIGDWHVNRQGAPNRSVRFPDFEIGLRWRYRRDRDGEGDEGRRRYLKGDGDIEINNVPCVIRRRGPYLRIIRGTWNLFAAPCLLPCQSPNNLSVHSTFHITVALSSLLIIKSISAFLRKCLLFILSYIYY
jgi:hypothetical protein